MLPSDEEFEDQLLPRLRVRDERAFTELVRRYERRVFALTMRMLGNATEAEEVTHEAFIQVFKALGSFRGESKLSTWIFRIAVNLCKNRIKYLQVRHAREHDEIDSVVDQGPLTHAPQANVGIVERPDEAAEGRQLEAIVRESMLEVEESFRECLILRDVEELSYEEIGEITGLAAGTVKSRIYRARTALREIVERKLGKKF